MRRDIIVVNDFYQDPDAIAAYARAQPFYNPYALHTRGSSAPEHMVGADWYTTRFKKAAVCPFKSSREFIKKLESITGEEIDQEHWKKDFPENEDGSIVAPRPDLIDPSKPGTFNNLLPGATSCRWNCSFTVKTHAQPLGTGVHNHMRDEWNTVGDDGWAGIVYLNKNAPRDSGLKLFRNRHGNNLEWMSSAERWELVDDFANIYNRLILVRGSMPHVGGPGFGNSIETGRLFQTLFFKVKKGSEQNSSIIAL